MGVLVYCGCLWVLYCHVLSSNLEPPPLVNDPLWVIFQASLCAPLPSVASFVVVVATVHDARSTLPALIMSSAPHVQGYMFCDAGSSDDTRAYLHQVRDQFSGPNNFFISDQPWTSDYSIARNACLQQARFHFRGRVDHFLLMDTGDTLVVHDGMWRSKISAVYNEIAVTHHNSSWGQRSGRLILANRTDLTYRCAVHESLARPALHEQAQFSLIALQHRSPADPDVDARRNLAILKRTVDNPDDPCHARYLFYLGQTYFDLKQYDNAAAAYTRRLSVNDTYHEERYYATYKRAASKYRRAAIVSGIPAGHYLAAWQMRPWRAEALHDLMMAYHEERQYHACLMIATTLARIKWPLNDTLFVDPLAYKRSHVYDIAGICAYHTGDITHAKELWLTALETISDSADQERIQRNLAFTKTK